MVLLFLRTSALVLAQNTLRGCVPVNAQKEIAETRDLGRPRKHVHRKGHTMPDCRVMFPKNNPRRGEMFNAILIAFLNDPTLKPTPRNAGLCDSVLEALLNTWSDTPGRNPNCTYSRMALDDLQFLVAEARITWSFNPQGPRPPEVLETVLRKVDGPTLTISTNAALGEIGVSCEGIPHGHALAILGAAAQYFDWKSVMNEPYVTFLTELEMHLKRVIVERFGEVD